MAEQDMGTEAKENPVLEQPEAEGTTTQPEVDHRANAEALLSKLEQLKIDSPERLEGIAYASQQAGRYANDLGSEREQAQALRAELEELRARVQQQQNRSQNYQPQQYDEGYGYEQPRVNITPEMISSIVGQQVNDAIGRYTQGQIRASQAVLNEYASIQSDPDYSIVQDVWDKHIANPRVQMAIQSGQTSLSKEFNKTRVAYYKGIAMNARDTMRGLLSQKPKGATPPHMEQSTTQTPGMPVPETNKDKLRDIAKNSMGTTDDLEAMFTQMLPSDDGFLMPPTQAAEFRQPRRR